jgi:hypothetical protein
MLKGNQHKPNYKGIPSVVFTVPSLASVGLQEQAARDIGLKLRVNQDDTASWYSSRRVFVLHSTIPIDYLGSTDEDFLGITTTQGARASERPRINHRDLLSAFLATHGYVRGR